MNPTGWIEPKDRNQQQQDGHVAIVNAAPRFQLPPVQLAKGDLVNLTKVWSHPDVITDIGREFIGFYQFTGSCVGVSGGNGVFTVGGVQRAIKKSTKCFIPWWPLNYGRSRLKMGDRNQGEGSICSYIGQSFRDDAVFEASLQGLPQYTFGDGIRLDERTEMMYSDGDSQVNSSLLNSSNARYPVKSITPLYSTDQIKNSIVNGNPVNFGCDYFVQSAQIVSGGGTPYVRGKFDGRGGHATCLLAVWEHPNDGTLYGYSNQWPASVYPKDPAGLARCCCWLPESEINKIWNWHASDGETMGFSHLDYLAVQPEILEQDWYH